jgi:hypothetical protein
VAATAEGQKVVERGRASPSRKGDDVMDGEARPFPIRAKSRAPRSVVGSA